MEAAWRSGAALAGCSAGAIALTDWVPAVRSPAREPEPRLGVIGIDEDTAIVDLTGGGRSWQVHGRRRAWVLDGGQDSTGRPFPAGAAVNT